MTPDVARSERTIFMTTTDSALAERIEALLDLVADGALGEEARDAALPVREHLPRAVHVEIGLALAGERGRLGVLARRRGPHGDVEVLPLVLAAEDRVGVLDRLLDRGRHRRRDDERRARARSARAFRAGLRSPRPRNRRAARPPGSRPGSPGNASPRIDSSSRTSIQVPGETRRSTNSWNARAVVANPFGMRTPARGELAVHLAKRRGLAADDRRHRGGRPLRTGG